MILNVQYIRNTPNIFTDSKGSKEKLNMHYGWMMYGETFLGPPRGTTPAAVIANKNNC